MKTVEVVQDRTEIKTLGDFVSQNGGLFSGFSIEEFYSFQDNKERIFSKYEGIFKEQEITRLKSFSGPQLRQLPVLVGTKLLLPVEKINREYFDLYFDGTPTVNTTNTQSFVASKLLELSSNPLYSKVVKTKNGENIAFKDTYPDITVIVWSRVLNAFINVSPFLKNVVTNTSDNGGNFIINLPPLQAKVDDKGKWYVDQSSIRKVRRGDSYGYECSFSLFENGKRRKSFFDYVFQKNDLVYIQFETLQIEKEKRKKIYSTWEVDSSYIKNGIFDMVGLIDDVGFQYAPENNEYSVNIVGRDMFKVLIDDGTYFFPLEFGGQNVFANVSQTERENSSFAKRSLISGKLLSLSAYTNKTIDFAISFVVERLSNIGVVPDNVLSFYQNDKRGVWKLIEFLVDDSPNVSRRRIIDSSVAQEQGALLNFIRKIVQEPFFQFFGDTYGDKFYFITRQSPFDREGFVSLLNGSVRSEISGGQISITNLSNKNVIDVEASDVVRENIDWDNSQVYSWYRIVPKAIYLGSGSNITLAFIPAVFFQRYVDVFGAKPYEEVYNYSTFDGTVGADDSYRYSYTQEQVYKDLKFVIESNAYLPFTRSGTIILNGDRRIKRGTLIRYKATGEIFYVNRVTNNITFGENNIDRYTLIEVSRGMVEKYIEGFDVEFEKPSGNIVKKVSYFSIINMPIDTSKFIQGSQSQKNIKTQIVADWKEDDDIFEFFLNRRQWK